MSDVQNIKISEPESGLRLDRFFKEKFPQIPRSMLEKWCRKGNIRVDGKRVKLNHTLESGQTVRVPPLPELDERPLKKGEYFLTNEEKQLIKSMILHEDEHIIVLNKPEGLAVQGGTGIHRHVDGLLNYFKISGGTKPHLVHRLDKDTSGLLVVARSLKSAQYLSKAFLTKTVHKTYWAIVVGYPDPQEGTIKLRLDKALDGDREKMEVSNKGKMAVTHLKVLDHASDKISWVELIPETGRTHQLRVHCEAIDHPILGDGKYGGPDAHPFNERFKMHLHARVLDVPYPDGTRKTFEAPLPDHMADTFQRFGFGV